MCHFVHTRNPLDWFEVRLTITLELAFYVKIGIFLKLGFVTIEFVLFEFRLEYSIVLLSLYYHPPYPSPVGDTDSSGNLSMEESDLACETKGGSVGNEGGLSYLSILLFQHDVLSDKTLSFAVISCN